MGTMLVCETFFPDKFTTQRSNIDVFAGHFEKRFRALTMIMSYSDTFMSVTIIVYE